jgi:hypothetical protein
MFGGWENFYIIVGSTAGALIGVMFVVATLSAGLDASRLTRGAQIYITPVVFNFTVVVIVSALSGVPDLRRDAVGAILGLCAALGSAYSAMTMLRVLRVKVQDAPHWSDKWCYGILPFMAYLGLIAAACAVWLAPMSAAKAIGSDVVVLLLIGIRNAWDLATFLVSLARDPHKDA